MCVGEVPFYSEDPLEVYQLILRHSLKFPKKMGKSNRGIVEKLLELNPTKRMGSGKNGYVKLKKDKWFSGFHWRALEDRDESAIEIPIKPKVKHAEDASNFDQDAIGPEPSAEPCNWNPQGF